METFKSILNSFYYPLVVAIIGGVIVGTFLNKRPSWSEILNFIKAHPKKIVVSILGVIFIILIPAFIISSNNNSDRDKNVTVSDISFDIYSMGIASLYDNERLRIWFESDEENVSLCFMLDNTGATYASIKKAKLIIDDYTPVSMDEILLFRGESMEGVPPVAKTNINLFDIPRGHSEHDIYFKEYYDEGSSDVVTLKKGQTFNVEPSSQISLETDLDLNQSGIYTYHISIEYEYNRTSAVMKTEPLSFIYIAGDSRNYKYNEKNLATFSYEGMIKDEEEGTNRIIYYSIEGRTLRIYDTKIIFWNYEFGDYSSLIDTIIIEDGTTDIENGAFGILPSLKNVKTVYLPKSLEHIDFGCFDLDGKISKIYFEGTEEQWNVLINKADEYEIENIKDIDITYNYVP